LFLHDKATAETDKRLAARVAEVEARETRAAKLEAEAQAHLDRAKAVRKDAEDRYQRAFG
jgi:hypothetical protein